MTTSRRTIFKNSSKTENGLITQCQYLKQIQIVLSIIAYNLIHGQITLLLSFI